MYAVRQIQHVQNGTVVVQLPKGFPSQSVEVIILPIQQTITSPNAVKQNEAQVAIHDFLTMDTSHFTPAQQQAYTRSCALIQQGRRPDEPRILGLFAGLGEIADDFNDPLPDEDLFWGEETDEYGMMLEQ